MGTVGIDGNYAMPKEGFKCFHRIRAKFPLLSYVLAILKFLSIIDYGQIIKHYIFEYVQNTEYVQNSNC